MKKNDWNVEGLRPLSDEELMETNGGSFPWVWLGQQVISHWDEIKKGLSDGWNFPNKQ
ncbi:hypothetical protein SAMN05444410_104116 [Hydrobacter penzbergensis]|jgi:hypothetical protein|uniref:Uncharacterized protein n=1 Tax=Hydrobacter penzbergensis TaxID=1235997 RepID=A0A8X8LEH6_9BACT|nr:hypothetical protein [Hydrobacter penzbergensis]MBN8719991.1 hypothetical protein [Sediminibacterium magnilacihabitans]PQV60814.1 hypothetical protein CLV53_10580 [Sediminibacterium magnilacihabitans]SDW61798.1 hypothetical protein SAMN05444410_104116 [Hydrobacter penzbergensis]